LGGTWKQNVKPVFFLKIEKKKKKGSKRSGKYICNNVNFKVNSTFSAMSLRTSWAVFQYFRKRVREVKAFVDVLLFCKALVWARENIKMHSLFASFQSWIEVVVG